VILDLMDAVVALGRWLLHGLGNVYIAIARDPVQSPGLLADPGRLPRD